jgi:DNA processing protein
MFDKIEALLRPCLTPESSGGPYPVVMPAVNPEHAALVVLLRTVASGSGQRWSDVTARILDLESAELALADPGHPQHLFDEPADIAAARKTAEHDLVQWAAAGWRFISVLDADYPARLRDIHQAPPFLFAQGELRADEKAVAVVGSREASDESLGLAAGIAALLVRDEISVLSGLADGVDAAAHRAALAARGRTIAVIGSGIARAYPAKNEKLQREIARRGLVLSQFWPDAPPQRHNFLMRNAVMSGLGRCTVVVQAAEKSGARAQARMAVEHGRPVILLRQVVEMNRWAQQLVGRPGVHEATTADDVMAHVSEVLDQEREASDLVRQILTNVA